MNLINKIVKWISLVPTIITGVENLHGAKQGAAKAAEAQELSMALLRGLGVAEYDLGSKEIGAAYLKLNDAVVEILNLTVWAKAAAASSKR